MTKLELLRIFPSAAEVARFFGITEQAVCQWADREPIPELREMQLRLRRPELCESEYAPAKPKRKVA